MEPGKFILKVKIAIAILVILSAVAIVKCTVIMGHNHTIHQEQNRDFKIELFNKYDSASKKNRNRNKDRD